MSETGVGAVDAVVLEGGAVVAVVLGGGAAVVAAVVVGGGSGSEVGGAAVDEQAPAGIAAARSHVARRTTALRPERARTHAAS